MTRFAALALVLLLCAAVGRAEPARYGNLVFDRPASVGLDSDEIGQGGVTAVRLDDGDDATPDLVLLGGTEAADREAARFWAENLLRGVPEKGGMTQAARWDWTTRPGSETGIGAFTTADDQGRVDRTMLLVMVLRAGGRADAIMTGVRFDEKKVQADFVAATEAAMDKLDAFAAGAAFVTAGADPLPPARPGPLEGLYWGSTMTTTPVYGGGVNTSFHRPTMAFYPDGTFSVGVPKGGIGAFDYAAQTMADATSAGRYFVEGDRLTLRPASGSATTVEMSADGGITVDGTEIRRVALPPDGSRLEATRETFSFKAMPSVAGTFGGSGASSQIVLRRDGTFAAAASSSFNSGGPYHQSGRSSEAKAAGTYAIKGGELALTADGETGRMSIFYLDEGSGPTLWIGDDPAQDAKVFPPESPAVNPLAPPRNPLAGP